MPFNYRLIISTRFFFLYLRSLLMDLQGLGVGLDGLGVKISEEKKISLLF